MLVGVLSDTFVTSTGAAKLFLSAIDSSLTTPIDAIVTIILTTHAHCAAQVPHIFPHTHTQPPTMHPLLPTLLVAYIPLITQTDRAHVATNDAARFPPFRSL